MPLAIWNIVSNLRHFENEKFSEISDWLHYIMLYSYLFDILFNLRFIEHNYFHSWVAEIKILHFMPELLHVWTRVINDTTS